jgi:hypothetical protein
MLSIGVVLLSVVVRPTVGGYATSLLQRRRDASGISSGDYAEFRAYGLDLAAAADALAANGQLAPARSQRVLDDLQAASMTGTYFGSGLIMLGFGRIPAA